MRCQISKEIRKRNLKPEEDTAVIGPEIKNRRVKLSRTLNIIAYKTCSVSYLSKLENNRILPNQQYVRELCDKVDLSVENIDTLLKSKVILIDSVKCFLSRSIRKLEKYYNDSLELNNYRAALIKLIYFIYNEDIEKANKLYPELISLITTMTDIDLVIFSLFSGILHYLNFQFEEALDDLLVLSECQSFIELEILRSIVIFMCFNALNHVDTAIAYYDALEIISKHGRYELLESLHYNMGMYYAKNNSLIGLDRILPLLKNEVNIESIKFIRELINSGEKSKLNSFNDNKLNRYCQLIKSIINGNKDIKSYCKELDIAKGKYEADFDPISLQYYSYDEIDEKIQYITNVAFPRLRKTKNGFLIKYLFNDLAYLSINLGKYKMFCEWYIKFYNLKIIY